MDVAAVVRRHRDALLGTAFLLCGDERAAEDRVDRALSRLAPDDDHAAAVRALVRTRPPRGAVAEAGADPWWVSPAELATARAAAAALDALAAADRTALVLDHEGLPADQDRLTRARARVADPAAALGGLLAVRRPPALDDDAAVAVVAGHRRTRRRRPLAAVAALAVLTLLAVLAVRLPGPAPAAPVADGRWDGPVRGSLAGDDAFLTAALDTPWSGSPAPADRRVVFAGDLLDARWVLVVGDTGDGLRGQWSTAPVGAPAQALAPANPAVALRADRPAALLADRTLLVVAADDEGVRVSTGQVVGPSGGVQRVFRALPVEDGVGALQLAAPDPGGVALQVRVARSGDFSSLTLADVPVTRAGGADATARAAVGAPLRGAEPDAGARQAAADTALAAVAAPTGLDPAALEPVLLWAGTLPHPVAGPVDAVVLAVPVPSGALVVSTAWALRREDGTLQEVGCGSRAFPAGTDPATVVAAARCVVADRDTGAARATVVVTGPTSTDLLPDEQRTVDVVVDAADGTSVPVSATGPTDLFAG
ncbi:hypothetical protein SAMN05660199_03091 [Klenkia soli]|uniref:DNA-directed RNA polymerase specialized sigma subunit, sigma24 family n=1 Tax=Klenkia soli TaxID=1052260 RepID=A0A1H0PHU4_9ACTN|nr:hypothetical protein [Klenkia soli]SDP04340.1 hypothetical protein SAMN05660199_03091 [Klenkia soli]